MMPVNMIAPVISNVILSDLRGSGVLGGGAEAETILIYLSRAGVIPYTGHIGVII